MASRIPFFIVVLAVLVGPVAAVEPVRMGCGVMTAASLMLYAASIRRIT